MRWIGREREKEKIFLFFPVENLKQSLIKKCRNDDDDEDDERSKKME